MKEYVILSLLLIPFFLFSVQVLPLLMLGVAMDDSLRLTAQFDRLVRTKAPEESKVRQMGGVFPSYVTARSLIFACVRFVRQIWIPCDSWQSCCKILVELVVL